MTNRRAVLLTACAVLLALGAVPLPAQWCFSSINDDGFDTGCCGTPTPNLPVFPAMTTTGEYAALLACHPWFAVPPFSVTFSAPSFALCDYAIIFVNAQITPNENISGMLLAKYSRTWIDFNSPVLGQVWRFLVNGDLTCSSSNSINACTTPLPRCAALNAPVHFDGHIDYSCNPFVTSGFSISYSLNHMQGCVSHAPWSCVPLSGAIDHTEVSYHVVGPAPFTFGTGFQAPQGTINADAVRSSYLRVIGGFQYQCRSEVKTANLPGSGLLISGQPPHCGCGTLDQCSGAPTNCMIPPGGCFAQQFIQGTMCCTGPGGGFSGVPFAGTPISSTGFLSQTIGTWGGGTLYPGTGDLTIYFGVLNYTDPCAVANWNIHAVVGVGVSNVFGQAFTTTTPCALPPTLLNNFIDLQNVLPLNNPALPPGYGCLAASDVVWNLSL